MNTKRRMTWKTGIPFIILCIVIGLLVGWLADRAFATEELIPVSASSSATGSDEPAGTRATAHSRRTSSSTS
jgi:hypothetical protein